jgi:dTDP-4-dehydrorhamnose reductase
MKRITLIGADGQLGSDLLETLSGEDVHPLYYPKFDVTHPEESGRVLREISPGFVINTSAFHRVDECESRPLEAFRVNAFAVRDLAMVCREIEAVLVHFSTDYVFDGRKKTPYTEDDPPNPQSVYAVSKLAGEYFVRNIAPRHFVIRTCGLFGRAGCREKGRNFVETMIALADSGKPIRVVDDQTVAPTSTLELADRTAGLLDTDGYGLYHLTSRGQCTWYEFARAVFDALGRKPDLVPITTQELAAPALRPGYSILDAARAEKSGLAKMSLWKDALNQYLKMKRVIR